MTRNDTVLNAGSGHEQRRPFEIRIDAKSMDHFQCIVALTRIMSAVFHKGGDVTYLIEEMRAVFDPKGGYFKAGGVYMPSLVAELGMLVEDHLNSIRMMHDPEMSEAQQALIAEKRKQIAQREGAKKEWRERHAARAQQCRRASRRHRNHWRRRELPAVRHHVPQVRHEGGDADGWMCDVFELWVFEVRVEPFAAATRARIRWGIYSRSSQMGTYE